MASISRDSKTGCRSIQFVASDGKRKTIRLGKVSQKDAESIKLKVEALAVAVKAGLPFDNEVAGWLAKIGDDLHAKLTAVGLVKGRATARLGEFLDAYLERRKPPAGKQSTYKALRCSCRRILLFFDRNKDIRDVTPDDADNFLLWMTEQQYSKATISRTMKYGTQFFRAALRAKVLTENPFVDIKTPSQVNKERAF